MIGKLLVAGVIVGAGVLLFTDSVRVSAPRSVGLVGDSLAVGLARALPKATTVPIKSSAKGGSSAVQWTRQPLVGQLASVLSSGPTIVLFSLGTNDLASPSFNQEVLDVAFNTLADMCREAGAQAVFLEPPREKDRGPIADAAASADCVVVSGIKVSMAPGDDIHPSGKGYDEWAVHIVQALEID